MLAIQKYVLKFFLNLSKKIKLNILNQCLLILLLIIPTIQIL